MGDVVVLGNYTTLPIPVERVLNGGKDLEVVLVIGVDKDGKFHAACSQADLRGAVFLAQRFVHKALHGDYGE